MAGQGAFANRGHVQRFFETSHNMNREDGRRHTIIIVALAFSIIVLVWIFVLSQVRYERREAAEAAIRANTQRVMAFEQYVARTLEQADIATSYIVDQYASILQSSRQSQSPIKLIDKVAFRLPAIREITVINRQGSLVATSAQPLPKPINLFHTDAFQWHLSRPTTVLRVNAPSRSRFNADWLLTLSRRVNLADGSFGGIVSVAIRPNELTDFLQDATLDDTDLVSVIGMDGITRARREGNALSFGQNLQGKLVMQMQQKSPNISYLGPSSIDGLVRYFSHRRLPQYDLFVTSGVAEGPVLAPVRARANAYFAGGAIISLATILATWLLITITNRRILHEAAIITANERLHEAQKLAKLGDWSFDIKRKEFSWSAELCAMYERSVEEPVITLNKFSKIMGQHGMQIFQTALTHSEISGGRYEFELAVRLPSGDVRHRRIVSVPRYDASEQLIEIYGTDQDITPRKQLESLRRQVGQLSKLDAIKAIAATLAHELNQPLTAASNYLSGSVRLLSARNDPNNQAIVDALVAVRDQIYHAGEIIRRVRNMIDNGPSRSVPTSLYDVIFNAVSLFEGANPDCQVNVRHQTETKRAEVSVDPVQVQQILVNLMRNAHDACGNSPQITINTTRGQNGLIDISVTDNGSGITSAETDLFSSFITTKEDGLGLGLAICRTLIESMGGRIWVEKTGPQGTTICFSVRELAEETNVEGDTQHSVAATPDNT